MKKLILICVALIGIAGCGSEPVDPFADMVCVNKGTYWSIYYQRTTKVMYAVSERGVFHTLVSQDGSPLIYEEMK